MWVVGWEKLESEVLHRGEFLSVWRDRVVRPDLSEGTYEHVEVADTVRVIALDGKGGVLLVEDAFYLQGRRMPHLPGGSTDGEAPLVAGQRELTEETGFVARRMDLLATLDPLPATTAARVHLIAATNLTRRDTSSATRDATEVEMTMEWWPLTDAITAVRTGLITDAGSVAGLLLAAGS